MPRLDWFPFVTFLFIPVVHDLVSLEFRIYLKDFDDTFCVTSVLDVLCFMVHVYCKYV